MCSDNREGGAFPELLRILVLGPAHDGRASRRSEGCVQEHSVRLRLGGSGVEEALERGDRDQLVVDSLEEPIRYSEGNSGGI